MEHCAAPPPPGPPALRIVPVILSIISEEIRQTLQCMAVFLVLGELWGSFMHIVPRLPIRWKRAGY